MKKIKVGPFDSLRENRPLLVSADGDEIAVVRCGHDLYAMNNRCPHQHFSKLHEGVVQERTITCPMHGWTFDLETGKALHGDGRLKKYEISLEKDIVYLHHEEHDNG